MGFRMITCMLSVVLNTCEPRQDILTFKKSRKKKRLRNTHTIGNSRARLGNYKIRRKENA